MCISLKSRGQLRPEISYGAFLGWRNENLINSGHITKMAAMLVYGENFKKNLCLLNQKVDDLETWY